MRPALALLLVAAACTQEAPRAGEAAHVLIVPLGPPLPALPLPPVAGPEGRPLVVVDPGHGGHDPGAATRDGGIAEKDVTLAVGRAVRDAILAEGGMRVALTRADDRYLLLPERAEIARRLGAVLFVSIHADSAPVDGAAGATVYVLSEQASDSGAARLAARENRADVWRGRDLGGRDPAVAAILRELSDRETRAASRAFAQRLRRAGGDMPFRTDYLRSAGFQVLRSDIPSVLLEVGYLTNATDAERLRSAEGRAAIARTVARAARIQVAADAR